MELVKQFNSELSALYESKPPISKAKMTSITRTAIKAIKLYKHVVQSVEKFIQKCKPEYKVPGLYVIDSIVRQSRHQFGTEKDVFAPRFARNLQQTFIQLFNCPPEDKSKVIRVLNLWQKNAVFESEVIQPLFDLADPNHPVHKEQPPQPPSNGITPVKPPSASVSAKKEGGTAGWVNQLHSESTKPLSTGQAVDVNILQQLQHLQHLLLDQQTDKSTSQAKEDQVKFDKKLLDFDYGEEEEDDGTPAQHHSHSQHQQHQQQQQQQQVVAGLDSIGSILANPEVLRQLQSLQHTLTSGQGRQQQLEIEEKMRKMQEMRQQEEEFDKHLAQTVPNLPFADECELKPGGELSGFPGMDLSQPPPGYLPQQKIMVPPGMMLKPPPSPLEDGEHASSDADERMGRPTDEGGPSVVVLDSDSPTDSPAHGRRRRRRSRSHSRSRRRSRSRSRNKRRRSSSYDEKDWEKVKQREAEKERERERKRRGLPPFRKNHLAVCSTTLWIGHLSKLVQQEELSDTFGKFGDIVSIDLIPPRGCAFICMNRRQDAFRALQDLKHHKMQGKTITLAWAPGKGMKGKEYKDYWEVEQGVSYIPWSKITPDTILEVLEEGGMIDEESFPEWLKEKQRRSKDDDQNRSQTSSQAGEDDLSKGAELDIPVPAPTLPGYIPLPDGPQPNDMKVNQPPPNMPPLMAGPLGMMPPFGLPNVPRLLGPMGMAMGPGLMPNVPLGVPPPGMQGLMGNPLMHQQMLSRMPQPVGSPFNPPPGVGILGGHPQLSQIPLPGGQDKGKGGRPPLGVPPPSDPSGLPPSFTDSMMQIPFTLPPQLQMPGLGMLTRTHLSDKGIDEKGESKDKRSSSPSRNDPMAAIRSQFGHPPPLFSPSSMMKIPPPMAVHSLNKSDINDEDKDEREARDKDYRESLKDYKDRDKDRERDRDYRNKRDRDYRGDRDYRDRFDKDYRERDKDYRDKDRDRKDRRDRDKDDKSDQDFKDKEGKMDDKDRKDDSSKDDKNYRDRSRNRDRDRDRDRDRGRDRSSKWGDRDRERGRDRDDKRGRDRERDNNKEIKGRDDRDKGSNLQDRLRNMAQDQDRDGDFARGGMDSDNFQGPGGRRNENFHHDGFPPDMHGRHPNNRREGFDNRGQRDLFDLRGPPPDGFDPRGPPPRGSIDNFGPRGPPPDGFGSRGPPSDDFGPRGPPPDGFGPIGPPPDGFGPRGPPPDGFGPRGPPPDGFGPRGPPPDAFGPRGPPPDGFGSRGPHSDRYDARGPPPGVFGRPDNFDMRGPPPDFEGTTPDNFRGPPPDGFNRGHPCDNFGPGGPPGDNFMRGPPDDEFGHPPFEGFGGPPAEFQPRIRIEFFARGRGRGGLQENFRGRGSRGGPLFSPRGGGLRGPRPGAWMEGEGPSSGFNFPPRGFGPSDGPERFTSPGFDENVRGRGGQIRGRGRGHSSRSDERRKDEEETAVPSPKRLSRWSNPSPPPSFIQPDTVEKTVEETSLQTQQIEPKHEDSLLQQDSCKTITPDNETTLLQQDSCKTITPDNETSKVDSENPTDISLPEMNENLQGVDQTQTEFSNLFERPCTTPPTFTADDHTSADLAAIPESNTGIENSMCDEHMPDVSGSSMEREQQFSSNEPDAHRQETLGSEVSDVGVGHFENSSQLNFEPNSARLDEECPGNSFINQESATLSIQPQDEDRPMFDELSLENKLDLSVLSQNEDFLPSVANDSDQDFNSHLFSPSDGQALDNNSFLAQQELPDHHERQDVSSENNCINFESELNDPAFTVEDGTSCGEATNESVPDLHEQSVEETNM